MSGWWVSELLSAPNGNVLVVSWVFWVLLSICLHELAHGWAAIRLGDRTPIETGHMTWSPLVHMGVPSLVAFALLGIAWGMMPVDPSRMRGRHSGALVAVAGPLMNLALFLLCITAGALWLTYANAGMGVFHDNLAAFFRIGAMLNIVLMLFNLLPVPPLDGSRILADFIPAYRRLMSTEKGAILSFGLFMLVFFFGGRAIFPLAFEATAWATGLVLSVLP